MNWIDRRLRRIVLGRWGSQARSAKIPPGVYRELIDAATSASVQLQLIRRDPQHNADALDTLDGDLDALIRTLKRHRPTQ